MKTIFLKQGLTISFIVILFFSSCGPVAYVTNDPYYAPQDGANITFQTFYDDLSPYGTWMNYPEYGYVWNPGVSGDFRPYDTNGYWTYTSEGWAWVSNYSWGWAPFHYGRWVYDDLYGWLWIPGYDWSPAWVTWGVVDDYYAWAPLMPGVNVNVSFGSYRPNSYYWNFVNRANIYNRNISSYVRRQPVNITNRITILNDFGHTRNNRAYYSQGPNINEVRRYSNANITPVTIRQVNTRDQMRHDNNQYNVYRPDVQNNSGATSNRGNNNTNVNNNAGANSNSNNSTVQPRPQQWRRVQNTQQVQERTSTEPTRQVKEQRTNVQNLPTETRQPVTRQTPQSNGSRRGSRGR
ncbi:MAG: hypothetical protein QM640_04395 [Niabella sp.]